MNGLIVSVIVIFCFLYTANSIPYDYWTARAQILTSEQKSMLGGQLDFKHDERIANDFLMTKKRAEFENGLFVILYIFFLTLILFTCKSDKR